MGLCFRVCLKSKPGDCFAQGDPTFYSTRKPYLYRGYVQKYGRATFLNSSDLDAVYRCRLRRTVPDWQDTHLAGLNSEISQIRANRGA